MKNVITLWNDFGQGGIIGTMTTLIEWTSMPGQLSIHRHARAQCTGGFTPSCEPILNLLRPSLRPCALSAPSQQVSETIERHACKVLDLGSPGTGATCGDLSMYVGVGPGLSGLSVTRPNFSITMKKLARGFGISRYNTGNPGFCIHAQIPLSCTGTGWTQVATPSCRAPCL
jgi:hypothetical protein